MQVTRIGLFQQKEEMDWRLLKILWKCVQLRSHSRIDKPKSLLYASICGINQKSLNNDIHNISKDKRAKQKQSKNLIFEGPATTNYGH